MTYAHGKKWEEQGRERERKTGNQVKNWTTKKMHCVVGVGDVACADLILSLAEKNHKD